MFTAIFQTVLALCVTGTVFYAILTWIQDRREERQENREFVARLFADSKLLDAIVNGAYHTDARTAEDIKTDRQFMQFIHLDS